jgi:integrase/recombinase XerC
MIPLTDMQQQAREFLKHCAAIGLSAQTLTGRRSVLRLLLRYLRQENVKSFLEVQPRHLDAYFVMLFSTGIKPSVRRSRASVIRLFFLWLIENGKLLSNPARNITVPAEDEEPLPPAPLEEQEVGELIVQLPRSSIIDLRNRLHIDLLYSCGLRMSESLHLDLRDIDLCGNILFVRSGKGGKDRALPLMRGVIGCLRDYLAVRRSLLHGPDHGALLLNKSGRRLTQRPFRVWLKRLNQARIGKRPITPHLLRHSIAVHLLRAGADVRYIQEFLGHTNLNTTKIYLRLVPERLKIDYDNAMPEIALVQ